MQHDCVADKKNILRSLYTQAHTSTGTLIIITDSPMKMYPDLTP